jgi:hypothetical protein
MTIRSILKRAVGYGVTPPAAVLAGVSMVGPTSWDEPLILGAALWVTLAMAFAAFAIARVERRVPR